MFETKLTRIFLALTGIAAVLYTVLLLAVVATIPDLRLRALLVDDDLGLAPRTEQTAGVVLRQLPDPKCQGPRIPKPGDEILRIGPRRIRYATDLYRLPFWLRSEETPRGGSIPSGGNPLTHDLPWMVDEEGGPRWVEAECRAAGGQETFLVSLAVQVVPLSEVAVTLIWFLLELMIFSIAALAFWNRPFDRQATLFFAMCQVTMVAFTGGFHWWIVAGQFGLNMPFVCCAVLVPVVTLHFFLVFPRVKAPLSLWPRRTLAAIYAIPCLALIGFMGLELRLWWCETWLTDETAYRSVSDCLYWLRNGVYSYIGVAVFYFLATLASMIYSVVTTRNPVERQQVQWILWAGLVATLFIGYTICLALVSRTEFALGGGRMPMFFASLVFMLAYAIGISRYKLMLLDQLVSHSMWYYVLSYGSTGVISTLVSGLVLATSFWKYQPSIQQLVMLGAVLVIAISMLLWLRDFWQKLVDRRFFREKYQLDKVLQRMQQSVGKLADPQSLSDRMITSCRDVLQAEFAAFFVRDAGTGGFRLVAAKGTPPNFPAYATASAAVLQELQGSVTLLRFSPATREDLSPVQHMLRELHAELMHALEAEGEVAGLVALGPKRDNSLYTAEDVTFLTAVGQITGVALHCARVHQDLSRLNSELQHKVDRIAQQQQQIQMLQAEVESTQAQPAAARVTDGFQRDLIRGQSPALTSVLDTIRKVAPSDTSILIRGESGTGKEMLAQTIHQNSTRRGGPLVAVHCAALSPSLLESELFGHMKGAFTGAHADKRGRFEMAHGGTLFLDEVGDIPLDIQVKLLRVLQERSFEPVGGSETIRVDVRLVAATHQNLEKLIVAGRFREDLYYRLNVVSITLPPLRERGDDIFELTAFFLKQAVSRTQKQISRFDDEALQALLNYQWPGNIRELENAIERAVLLADRDVIALSDLPLSVQQGRAKLETGEKASAALSTNSSRHFGTEPQPLALPIVTQERRSLGDQENQERQRLMDVLYECRGNKALAARRLGMPRSTLFSKLKKYALDD